MTLGLIVSCMKACVHNFKAWKIVQSDSLASPLLCSTNGGTSLNMLPLFCKNTPKLPDSKSYSFLKNMFAVNHIAL